MVMIRLGLDISVAALSGGGASPSAFLTNLAHYWSLDEASDGSAPVARVDTVGALNLTDNNTTASAAGKNNNAADFEYSNSEYLSNATAVAVTGPFTVSLWVKPEELHTNASIMKSFRTSNGVVGDFMFRVGSSGQVIFYNLRSAGPDATGAHTTTATGLVSVGAWTHIVGRWDGSNTTIWVNGSSKAFSDGSTSTGWGAALEIGRVYANYQWDGLVDEPMVWLRALSDEEIGQLYNGGAGIFYPF